MPRLKLLTYWLTDKAAGALIFAMHFLPYHRRVPVAGWLVTRVIAPLTKWRRRIRANFAHALPDLTPQEAARIERATLDNIGRSFIEMFSGKDILDFVDGAVLEGGGVEALNLARADRSPVVLLSSHIGNYTGLIGWFARHGYAIGTIYRPLANPYFNTRYLSKEALNASGQPLFPRNKRGMAQMMRHLRDGGMLGIMGDQHIGGIGSEQLNFFGKPAWTTLSPAEIALKYNAPLVPFYAIRQANGLSFRFIVDAPIPHSTPQEMMQIYNDRLEALVRQHPEQWFWIHRRWKP